MVDIVNLKLAMAEALNKEQEAIKMKKDAVKSIKQYVITLIQESNTAVIEDKGSGEWTVNWVY